MINARKLVRRDLDRYHVVMLLHAAWLGFQIAANQKCNDIPTDAQRESLIFSIRDYAHNPERTPEESHALWCRHKMAQGWVYGPVKDEVAKTHPNMVPWKDLPEVERLKDVMHISALEMARSVYPGVFAEDVA